LNIFIPGDRNRVQAKPELDFNQTIASCKGKTTLLSIFIFHL